MSRWAIRFATLTVGVSGLVGFGTGGREAAAVPNPCPKYECTQTHAYWFANATFVIAYYDKDGVNDLQGIQEIFTPASAHENPLADPKGEVFPKHYNSCTPHCGKDKQGVWQAQQTVSPAGTAPTRA